MCGRAYQTYTDDELKLRYLNENSKRKPLEIPKRKPNYNFAPTQVSPIVLMRKSITVIDEFRWGLIPFWAKDTKIGYKLINARADTIAEKPSYRVAFRKRRCIVPFSGFIEWKRDGKIKRPFAIHLKDEPIMSVAGIWESWLPPDAEKDAKELHTFSVITTEPNSVMEKIHDRMPVILSQKDEASWLDPENEDIELLSKLLKPCPSNWLESYELSPLINSAKNNSSQVLEPLRNRD